jgi:hypothetical protein
MLVLYSVRGTVLLVITSCILTPSALYILLSILRDSGYPCQVSNVLSSQTFDL